jgi:hypothetical protein
MANETTQPRVAQIHPLAAAPGWDPAQTLKIEQTSNPLENGTLGDLGLAFKVTGPERFTLTVLVQEVDKAPLQGIQPSQYPCFDLTKNRDRWFQSGVPGWS